MTSTAKFISPDEIRRLFSEAMSAMYAREVPAYQTLMDMVVGINQDTLEANPDLNAQLEQADNLDRITEERHGAIRLGKPSELHMMRRLFAVMGMSPVSYYDLSVAGIPVHATAFRSVSRESLSFNPFRVFCSLLRLDLIEDEALRKDAQTVLEDRDIFTAGAKKLIEKAEAEGGLSEYDASRFVEEALETFRWQNEATVSADLYQRLHDAHRLIADVVSFKGPHINHLTPRTLDIDTVQKDMPANGITPKATIEGPPPRKCPLLLRQTSFKALEESVMFPDANGNLKAGSHTARFGEIEQRGGALTPKGRKRYDELLHQARARSNQDKSKPYEMHLADVFADFPDDYEVLRSEALMYFEYHLSEFDRPSKIDKNDVNALIDAGVIIATPIVYEDFLPVSAAGIFQSNLGGEEGQNFAENHNQKGFEQALGAKVLDEFTLYEQVQNTSLANVLAKLG